MSKTNEGVLHISQSSPSDGLVSHPEHLLTLCRDAVGVFYRKKKEKRKDEAILRKEGAEEREDESVRKLSN